MHVKRIHVKKGTLLFLFLLCSLFPILADVNPDELLLATFGITLGQTTDAELASLGRFVWESEQGQLKQYRLKNTYVQSRDGLAESLSLYHNKAMPEEWKQLGFDWKLSYERWITLLMDYGYRVEIESHPSLTMYVSHPSFEATLFCYRGDTPVRLELVFRSNRGLSASDPRTLNRIYIRLDNGKIERSNTSSEREVVLPEEKRRALAFSGILFEMDGSYHEWLGCRDSGEELEQLIAELKKDPVCNRAVESRESLLKSFELLEEGGHSALFNEFILMLDKNQEISVLELAAEQELEDEVARRLFFVARMRRVIGKRSLRAWDYGRIIALCRWGFGAGYLSEAEAWQKILSTASQIERLYYSWEDYGANFILGSMFWASGFDEADDRGNVGIRAYTRLIHHEDSVWQLPWMTSGKRAVERAAHGTSIEEILYFNVATIYSWKEYKDGLKYLGGSVYDDAVRHFKNSLRKNPDFAHAGLFLGLAHYYKGEVRRAIELYEPFVQKKPDDYLARTLLGEAYESDLRAEESALEFEESIRIDGQRPEGYLGLGRVRLKQERYDEARNNLRIAEKICRDGENDLIYYIWFLLGLTYFNGDDYTRALAFFQRSYMLYRKNGYLNYYIGLCFLNRQDPSLEDASLFLARAESLGIELTEETQRKLKELQENEKNVDMRSRT